VAEPLPLLLLDGGTGTELPRRGFDTTGGAWSAPVIWREPALLAAIHEDYARAGADVITANTFRTQRRALSPIGEARRAREWTVEAVRIAREAVERAAEEHADRPPIRVAGSVAPLGDSYTPDLAPDEATALVEHREHVGHLAEAGVDMLLVETMTTIGESRAATLAATETGLETWTSVTTDATGLRLLSGEPLDAWVEAIAPLRPAAILVNCVAPDVVRAAAPVVVRLAGEIDALPGAYANLGSAEPLPGGRFDIAMTPEEYATAVTPLLDAGVRIVGGCCGTTPGHIRALRTLLDERLVSEAAEREAADPEWRALIESAAAAAGGGRALVVGGDGVPGSLDRYQVVRPDADEIPALPKDSFRLAIVDAGAAAITGAVRALEADGWLVMRVRGEGHSAARDALPLDGLDVREFRLEGTDALILARRST
jgi:S-methylmethionine-dependent homocysteine/selenocysteine methylase